MKRSPSQLKAHRAVFALIALVLLCLAGWVWISGDAFGISFVANHSGMSGLVLLMMAVDMAFMASCAHDALNKLHQN